MAHYQWDLAIFNYCDNINLSDIDYKIIINPYKTKWFADPFILSYTTTYLQLLVEEFDSNVGRGRIAKIDINLQSYTIENCHIILDLPTHVSFPVIYNNNNTIYVHPENSASGSSYIYKYDKNTDTLVDPIRIIDEPITDGVIEKNYDKYRLYATCKPDPNGDILKIYESENFLGPYQFISDELFPNSTARMAGKFFNHGGRIIRPAQDCNGAYGKAVVFYDDKIEVSRLIPKDIRYCGIHTFNHYGEIGILDLKRWDFPLFIMLKDSLKKIIK